MTPDFKNFARNLNLELPPGKSAFLWGPRQVGKSTLLRSRFPQSVHFNFLRTALQFRFTKDPGQLREELELLQENGRLHQPIILDEIQKVPSLLDEVHDLIEDKKWSFILCGSSARKLKRTQANMLGGRAWRFALHPLTSREIGKLDLLRALHHGLLPSHYLASPAHLDMDFQAYVADYLKEEIQNEGLVRNIPAFSRFTDMLGFTTGEMVNYTNIAREAGVDAKTVREYFQILIDTYLGHFVEPYTFKSKRSQISSTPRFYLFDVGIAGYLSRRGKVQPGSIEFGRAFEHLIFMELLAYRDYSRKDFPVRYWRTVSGIEVDFILGEGAVAIEVKSTIDPSNKDSKGLRSFREDKPDCRALLVCLAQSGRKAGDVTILPWMDFLDMLWAGELDP